MIPIKDPEKVRAVLVAHSGWMTVAEGTFTEGHDHTAAEGRYEYVRWQGNRSMAQVYVDPASVLGVAYGEIGARGGIRPV